MLDRDEQAAHQAADREHGAKLSAKTEAAIAEWRKREADSRLKEMTDKANEHGHIFDPRDLVCVLCGMGRAAYIDSGFSISSNYMHCKRTLQSQAVGTSH